MVHGTLRARPGPVPVLVLLAFVAGCGGGSVTCGEGTVEDGDQCVAEGGTVTHTETVTNTVTNTITEPVTNTITNTITETVTVPVGDDVLVGGHYEAPLKRLAQILGDDGAIGPNGAGEDHMHVDEVRYRESDQRLFFCSYTFGVIDVSDAGDPEYLAQGYDWELESPVGRNTGCLHVDWDDSDPDIVYVTHRGNYDFHPHLSVVDLNTSWDDACDLDGDGVFDPEEDLDQDGYPDCDVYHEDDPFYDPILAPSFFEDGVSYEGLDAENGLVYVALHQEGVGVFQRDPITNEMSRVAGNDAIVANAYDIEVVGHTAYVIDEQAGLYILDVTDPMAITEVGYVFTGGISRDLAVDGDHAYIAGGGAGVVIVDVSDPALPAVVSYTDTGGTAVRLGYDQGKVAVAAWNDTRVYDVTDPASPSLVGIARIERPKDYNGDDDFERPDITSRVLGVDLHGNDLYVGDWMMPYTYRIRPEHTAPTIGLPEDIFYMSTGQALLGETGVYEFDVANPGNEPLVITDAWTTNPVFTIEPWQVEIAPGASARMKVTFTPTVADQPETAIVNIESDDPTEPLRKGYVVGNADVIGVGDPFPYTEGTDVHSLLPWASDSTFGSVVLVSYFATF